MTEGGGCGHPVFVRTSSSFAVVLVLVGCGGKVVDDAQAGAGDRQPTDTTLAKSEPTPTAPPPSPVPSRQASADPCGTICERDGRCGAFKSDCREYCETIRSDALCAASSNAYIQCYADNLDPAGCSVLPPACEADYCAYTRCAGKLVPSYCP